jgi:hypothetical protein
LLLIATFTVVVSFFITPRVSLPILLAALIAIALLGTISLGLLATFLRFGRRLWFSRTEQTSNRSKK